MAYRVHIMGAHMKRVIKFWNQYENDLGKFSDCSTKYEVLPILVNDTADLKELRKIATILGLKVFGRGGRYNGEFTREGKPDDILKNLLKENPGKLYLFTHDESGQFQNYFSVWEVNKKYLTKQQKIKAMSKDL